MCRLSVGRLGSRLASLADTYGHAQAGMTEYPNARQTVTDGSEKYPQDFQVAAVGRQEFCPWSNKCSSELSCAATRPAVINVAVDKQKGLW